MKQISTPRFSPDDVLNATAGSLVRPGRSVLFDGVSTDTRTIAAGSLFVPLAGARFDGYDYIGQAVGAGAAGILVQRGREGILGKSAGEAAVISVDDTLRALGDLARHWRAAGAGSRPAGSARHSAAQDAAITSAGSGAAASAASWLP